MTRHKKKTPNSAKPQAVTAEPSESRLRPWLLAGMTALFVARPLFPSESAANFGDGLSSVMLWIALAVFWLLGAVGRPRFSVRFGATDLAVLLLVVWHTAAALLAVEHGTPRPAVNMLWEWVGLGLCYFLARQFIVTPRESRAAAVVMIAVAVAASGYGLYQYSYEMPRTQARYEADPDRALREADMWFPPGSPERKAFEDRLHNTEPTAAFALTNSLAGFLTPWLVVLVGIAAGVWRNSGTGPFFGRKSHSQEKPSAENMDLSPSRRWWFLRICLCLAPIAMCLALTKSRSGYAAAVVGSLLAVWFARGGLSQFSRREERCENHKLDRRENGTVPLAPREGDRSMFSAWRRLAKCNLSPKNGPVPSCSRIGWKFPVAVLGVAALIVAVAVAMEGPSVLGRATKSFGYRVQYWESSVRMIADHPWFGCGPGNFQETYPQYKLPEASEEIADPHNFLLEICATSGIPAALAFLAVLGCFWCSVAKPQAASLTPSSPLSSDAWLFVLAGGGLGFLLSLPLGMLSAAPPGIAEVLLGLPLAAATILLLLGWIRNGQLPGWLPGLGVAALLIDLLATGGIGLPSVAGTFWLLLALGQEGRRPREFRAVAAWAALAVAILLAVACYLSAYGPVLRCQAKLRQAEREPSRAIEHLEAAAAADPLAAEPCRRLAAYEFDIWWQQPNNADFARFTAARNKLRELAPNSATDRLAAGDWALRAWSKKDTHGDRLVGGELQFSINAFRRAVDLYPNSALHRARLAEAYLAAGDRTAFRREAETALRLDEITPHIDKKLPADLRESLLDSLGGMKD